MRLPAAALLMLFVGQADDELPARLKREGWKAVEALIEKGESQRSALQAAAKGGDRDVAFFAGAALAELDAAKEGDKAFLVSKPPASGWKAPAFSFRKIHSWIERVYRFDMNQFDPGPARLFQFSGKIAPDGAMAFGERATVEVVEAIDDRGIRLEIPEKSPGYLGRGHERMNPGVRFSFDLLAPPPEVKVAKRIRLRVQVVCERKREEIVFGDLLKAGEQEKKSGAVAVKLIGANPSSGGEYQVKIEAQAPAGHPWLGPGEIALVAANGVGWRQRGHGSSHLGDRVEYSIHFGDPGGAGPPVSVVFPAVTETYVRVFYFEFGEVPLR